MRRDPARPISVALLLAGMQFAGPSFASADFLRTLHPYAEAGVAHDSNVFRVEDAAQVPDLIHGTQTSDTYSFVEAGLDAELTHQKQVILLRGRVFHNDYDRFNEVDFTGGEARVAWDWAAGRLWNGEIGYEFRRALRNFANQVTPHIDVGSSNVFNGEVERQLSNHWRLSVNGKLTNTEFSQDNSLDLRRISYGTSLAYSSRQENTVSLDASFSEKDSQGAANLDYTEFIVGPVMDWRPREHSRIRASLGYAERNQDSPAFGDYSGFVGRISGAWTTPHASDIHISAYREISSFGDEIATFAIVSGVSFDPTFHIGNHASVGVGVGYEWRDFRGEAELPPSPAPTFTPRDDEVLFGTLRFEWKFTENSYVALECRAEDRASTRIGKDYDYNNIALSFRIGL